MWRLIEHIKKNGLSYSDLSRRMGRMLDEECHITEGSLIEMSVAAKVAAGR